MSRADLVLCRRKQQAIRLIEIRQVRGHPANNSITLDAVQDQGHPVNYSITLDAVQDQGHPVNNSITLDVHAGSGAPSELFHNCFKIMSNSIVKTSCRKDLPK